jgi:hypothetical protein
MLSQIRNILAEPTITVGTFIKPNSIYSRTVLGRSGGYAYFPIVSTVTGLSKASLALVYTIAQIARAIFGSENRRCCLREASFGLGKIGFGLLEAVPIFGNIALWRIDRKKAQLYASLELENVRMNEIRAEKNDLIILVRKNGERFRTIKLQENQEIRLNSEGREIARRDIPILKNKKGAIDSIYRSNRQWAY